MSAPAAPTRQARRNTLNCRGKFSYRFGSAEQEPVEGNLYITLTLPEGNQKVTH